ncbi:hypothetical protein MHYP_G00362770 [Metynnis hypsauchen]
MFSGIAGSSAELRFCNRRAGAGLLFWLPRSVGAASRRADVTPAIPGNPRRCSSRRWICSPGAGLSSTTAPSDRTESAEQSDQLPSALRPAGRPGASLSEDGMSSPAAPHCPTPSGSSLPHTERQTVYFPEDHAGEAAGAGRADALASWGLGEDRQVCITTDSGTSVIRAAELNGWTRLQCSGRRLNSATEKVNQDKRVDRAVGVCEKVVAAVSFSWKKKRDLAAAQEEYNLPKNKLV